jgi:hypothetical protein
VDLDPSVALEEVRSALVGQRVAFRRLAGNSLLVYFGGGPDDRTGLTFWLEPTWHLVGPTGVLTGSREAQEHEVDEHPESGFVTAGRAVDALVGRTLEALRVDERTHDLELAFDEGLVLRTFVSDPRDFEIWHVRENATGERLEASPRGLRRHAADADDDA